MSQLTLPERDMEGWIGIIWPSVRITHRQFLEKRSHTFGFQKVGTKFFRSWANIFSGFSQLYTFCTVHDTHTQNKDWIEYAATQPNLP